MIDRWKCQQNGLFSIAFQLKTFHSKAFNDFDDFSISLSTFRVSCQLECLSWSFFIPSILFCLTVVWSGNTRPYYGSIFSHRKTFIEETFFEWSAVRIPNSLDRTRLPYLPLKRQSKSWIISKRCWLVRSPSSLYLTGTAMSNWHCQCWFFMI